MDRGAWQATVHRVAKSRTPYSTGNYIQHLAINHNRTGYEKEYIYIYTHIAKPLCCTPETSTTL